MEGGILIPPSPNWFYSQATDSRTEDRICVTACFKVITVYQVQENVGLPKVLKVIPCSTEKVQIIRLCPIASNPDYGHAIVCGSDSSSVRLYNIHTGRVTYHHKEHQGKAVNGLAWGLYGEEEAVISVGGNQMVVWQPKGGLMRTHTIHQVSEISLVEVNPGERTQAIMAAGNTILLTEIKGGSILRQLQGHNQDIYCLKWFCGTGSPMSNSTIEGNTNNGSENKGKRSTGSESDNWRVKKSQPTFNGPFVVSSDYSRQIYLWDLTAKRYITNATVPLSFVAPNKKFQGKEKIQGKNHVALAWYNNELISSSPKGEILQRELWPGGAKYKMLHNFHMRVVYNIEVIGDVMVTFGQDRMIHGYHLKNSEHLFQFPTVGASPVSLAFCPHDLNRLAIGTQDNTIRLLNFESPVPWQSSSVWQNIKGKILSISWHPEREGRLLFGTGSGQVGFADIASGRVSIYAYYHQKPVYKVDWAPAVFPEKSGVGNAWCAYSFGDREIAMRPSEDAMADPVMLQTLISESFSKTGGHKCITEITEFSFSPDYKFIALGGNDGEIHIYRMTDLQLLLIISALRKAIQHILWKPQTDSSVSYIFAVGSNENIIYLFNVSSQLKDPVATQVITQATQELCSHESRVVWLSWSPHKAEVLASASYDHTVQLWDTKTGSPIVNYGGHSHRVFRVEFSPSDPDLMYSFADETTIHCWKPSQQTCKIAAESLAAVKEYMKKLREQTKLDESSLNPETSESLTEKKEKTGSNTQEKTSSGVSTALSNKKSAFKSFFPKLHSVCARKKSFFYLLILNMIDNENDEGKEEKEKRKGTVPEIKDLEDDLLDALEECSDKISPDEPRSLASISETCEKFAFLLEKDSDLPEAEDVGYALQLYGSPLQMSDSLSREIVEHKSRENNIQADLMHSWQGSLDEHIRTAARLRKLNPFLVSSAPQVSIKLWQFASEAYAEQLVNEGDIVTAATYLVNINKIEDAVELLMKHRLFREALAIVKCRLGYNEDFVKKVVSSWTDSLVYEGNFDIAAALQISIGQIEDAARTVSRRNHPGALFIASQLYRRAGKDDMAKSIGLLALKEICLRHEHEVIENYMSYLPDLQWFSAISSCHCVLLRLLQQVSARGNFSARSYFLQRCAVMKEKDSFQEECDRESYEDNGTGLESVLDCIIEEWNRQGFTCDQYPKLYGTISSSLSTQQTPSSVKQLWFQGAIAISALLMSPSDELWELHLSAALSHVLTWGKPDQIYHLSHALLPKGAADLSTVIPRNSSLNLENSKGLHLLLLLYYTSETFFLHSLLHKEGIWSSIEHHFHGNEGAKICDDTEQLSVPNLESESLTVLENASGIDNKLQKLMAPEKCEENKNTKRVVEDLSLGDQSVRVLPRTKNELMMSLHCKVDFFLSRRERHDLQDQIFQTLSDPKKLLLEISLKLRENEFCSDEDLKRLVSKLTPLE
ncbi:hypothetical protein SK128_007077 [Halocaridina rubra]|uniref:Gem-associated protein 5 n=1 Tax=Halocaridina rubra TaxID=373956 RepID=A0AAN9ADN1_HALRR